MRRFIVLIRAYCASVLSVRLPVRALTIALFAISAFVMVAGASEPWESATWTPLASGRDGAQHFIAEDAILRLPHAPQMASFYRKILFAQAQEVDGLPVDGEVAEIVLDCHSGRMDLIRATQLYQGQAVARRYFREENARRVKLDTLGEDALRRVCGKDLPRYVRRKDNPPPIGSDPGDLKR
ncbi:MAG: hypothetical protein IPK79_05810 [Vampirovibrionales bacterium]|nr:hypothetical protein [Vampirovibrionales bacterium]